jgi:hypothetical protein
MRRKIVAAVAAVFVLALFASPALAKVGVSGRAGSSIIARS